MNNFHLLGSLKKHLQESINLYFEMIKYNNDKRTKELFDKINTMVVVFKREIEKGKFILI
jgi:hypothetical protein